MKVSVIIPFLDEERALPMTLACLARAIGAHADTEVIAVDGGSRDASRTILSAHPYIRVLAAPRGRASQMNAGAAAARGEVLLFLHADTLVPEQALRAIAVAAAAPGFVYGGFHHRFSGDDWRLRVISALHNLRCRITATFYARIPRTRRRHQFAQVRADGRVDELRARARHFDMLALR